MGTSCLIVWSVTIILFQIFTVVAGEESPCVPGFESELLIFKVTRKHLRHGTILGKVSFTDCTGRTRYRFSSDDSRFLVQTDGTLTVKRQVVLHKGHQRFFIHSLNTQGQKMTVPVMVLYQKRHPSNIEPLDHTESHSANNTQEKPDEEAPILHFPKFSKGLKRRKRGWVLPPLSVTENSRGPYPLFIAQIRSDVQDKGKTKIYYRISGPGADKPPVGLFTIDRETGHLYVTQELDREKSSSYKFQAHAETDGARTVEDPMDVVINVIDQNDNKPVFKKATYEGSVPELSQKGFEVIKVEATDADEPNTDNSDIQYRILSQEPEKPHPFMFTINPLTGSIKVNQDGLDREKVSKYKLEVQVADNNGEGLTGFAYVYIKVTDRNDHAPVFIEPSYAATIEENKVDAFVVRMIVKDDDDALSTAWNAKFKIIDGDPTNLFSVKTGTNKQEGIITTAKGLDFEKTSKHILVVTVENEVPFVVPLPTSTATVVVTVKDVNEPPIFDPKEKLVSTREDLAEGSPIVQYIASDPDTARKQEVRYKVISDPAAWLFVNSNSGEITVRSAMDRESPFVKEEKYTALIGAYDNDQIPATGTGTLVIKLEDVNDNPPAIEDRDIMVCTKDPAPQLLTVTDKDGPGFTSPYSVNLRDSAKANWTAVMNGTRTGIILTLKPNVKSGVYKVALIVSDTHSLSQVSTITATVCDCTGEKVNCQRTGTAGFNPLVILGILAGVLLLLMVLALVLYSKWKKSKEPLLLPPEEDEVRDDLISYHEEGGGEGDQDFDLGVIHFGLDNRPDKLRSDMAPPQLEHNMPQYRPRPTDSNEISSFIDHNLKVADTDPTAPPFDSLLVFDVEGGGSEAGNLSSLCSSTDGDHDYDFFKECGPRFKKLADMYGGGEDDALL